MKLLRFTQAAGQIVLIAAFLLVAGSLSSTVLAQSPPNIEIDAKLSLDHVKPGRTVQGTVTMDIPSGYHVNSNRPLEKFLIPTQLQMDGQGLRVGPIIYPRPLARSLKFSKNKVAVFEGRTTIRFSVTVPRGFSGKSAELKGRLRYQSCSDDVCFPPRTREFSLGLNVD